MVLEVNIISKETIKPSSATPSHFQCFKFSVLDQLATSVYTHILLFYPSFDHKNVAIFDMLKLSLSKTLRYLYPLAGRLHEDGCSINCTDEGAEFYLAKVGGQQKEVLDNVDAKALKQLLPPCCTSTLSATDVLLAIQLSTFECGGTALGIFLSHKIGDGSSVAALLKYWAAISVGAPFEYGAPIVDCTSLFPPVDALKLADATGGTPQEDESIVSSKYVNNRFVYDGEKLKSLREKVSNCISQLENNNNNNKNKNNNYDCSKVVAVSAHIWGSIIRVRCQQDEDYSTSEASSHAVHCVDLRNRMIPPLPQYSLGNISQMAIGARWPNKKKVDYGGLATELREAIKKTNDEFVRKIHEGNKFFNIFTAKRPAAAPVKPSAKNFNMLFSSLCRFPFYEIDLGWGNPVWVATNVIPRGNTVVTFLDSPSGEGIEAWFNLLDEDIAKLEADQEFLAYLSDGH